jgi:hypothetical protein
MPKIVANGSAKNNAINPVIKNDGLCINPIRSEIPIPK